MNPRLRTGLACLLAGLGTGCGITDGTLKLPYTGYLPAQLSDGWQVSTPEAEGMDADHLEAVYQAFFDPARFPTAHSLLVIRHGRLVGEAYVRDVRERERYHHIQSATKSITSLLAGIAIDLGLIPSVDTPIYDFIPEAFDADVRKRAITLHHVLTMQTGLQFNNDDNTSQLVHTRGSSAEFVLHRSLVFTPGSSFYYHDGNPQLASAVIQAVSGMTEEAFGVAHLFGPLGISAYQWEHAVDGLTFGAIGLWLRPRDMARIGQMLLQEGEWQGRRIVSAEWIARATTPHTPGGDYGYYFWLLPNGAFQAEGHGGQVIRVDPARDLVVVMTADPNSASAKLSPGLEGLIDVVAAAVRTP